MLKSKLIFGLCCQPIIGFMFSSRLTIFYGEHKRRSFFGPFILGTIILPTFIITTPLIIIDNIIDACFFDKLYDNLLEKYEFKFNRYHQWNDKTKYYSNSHLILHIKKISNKLIKTNNDF